MRNALIGKRILVTESTEFMGPAICEVFAEQGATVVASPEKLWHPDAAERVVMSAGTIDVLVANLAFTGPTTHASGVSDTEWREVFAALVDPLPRLMRAAAPAMVARRSGKVLVIGSASALRGLKRAYTYSAARGAQLAWVQAVGVELAQHNVQVNAIAQNFVDNPDLLPARGSGQPPVPGASRSRGTARPAGGGAGGRPVCGVPLQRGGRLLRGPGVSGLRRLGRALTAGPSSGVARMTVGCVAALLWRQPR